MQEEKINERPTPGKRLWWDIFLTFFKIGAFTIGGGYVMVPFIEKEIVEKKKWMKSEEFLDMLAIAQSAPGVLATNIAVSSCYQIAGIPGAVFGALGAALPSFMIIIIIAMFLLNFQDNRYVAGFFYGAAPAVTMLLFLAAINMVKGVVKERAGMFVLVLGLLGLIGFGVHPILAILIAAVFGAFFYK
ncbi:chromate transporter [Dehalobacterium formicoaceticum]|uniref:chromate transporter n=1 Tax=Dehalobacterium formicoaceticum TaxID=51515 RepID=UPI0031F6131F